MPVSELQRRARHVLIHSHIHHCRKQPHKVNHILQTYPMVFPILRATQSIEYYAVSWRSLFALLQLYPCWIALQPPVAAETKQRGESAQTLYPSRAHRRLPSWRRWVTHHFHPPARQKHPPILHPSSHQGKSKAENIHPASYSYNQWSSNSLNVPGSYPLRHRCLTLKDEHLPLANRLTNTSTYIRIRPQVTPLRFFVHVTYLSSPQTWSSFPTASNTVKDTSKRTFGSLPLSIRQPVTSGQSASSTCFNV